MFLLISLAVANNYCIGGITEDQCKNMCKDFTGNFDGIYDEIPASGILNSINNEKHNLYIANNVSYLDTNHNLIFCDPSFHLIYQNPESKIIIKDHININSKTLTNAPILFHFTNYISYLNLEVETDENSNVKPFILKFSYYTPTIRIKFLSDIFPENLISISSDSCNVNIAYITKNVQKIFKNTDKFIEKTIYYYCISDKENKCSGYNLTHELIPINSISEANNYPNYIIVDTSVPQVYDNYYNDDHYSHIITSPGSDVTYYPSYLPSDGQFYVILHEDSIETTNLFFEGEGNFTFFTCSNLSLYATTKTNKNNFAIRHKHLFTAYNSHIHAIRNDKIIELEPKIYVPEYTLFYGSKSLSGLFESDKFIATDDGELNLYNITGENLQEYDYEYLTYYFQKGNHEIPKTWKRSSTFRSTAPNETNLIFNDVYSYDGTQIDNFITVNNEYESSYNIITIRPAKYFYLSSFKSLEDDRNFDKYNIQVDKDFIMYGNGPSWYYDMDEISHDQCTITGNGTIRFLDSQFMSITKELCKIDNGVKLELLESSFPSLNVCIGQSDPETCKAKINNDNSNQNSDWVWLRHLRTIQKLYNYGSIYITDKYVLYDDFRLNDIIITKDSHLTLFYANFVTITLYENKVSTYFYSYSITADDSSAKLTVLFTYRNNYSPNHGRDIFRIYYQHPVTGFDFRYYFNYDTVTLYMKYIENFTNNSIQLDGKCKIKIREHYVSRLGMFKIPNSLSFTVYNDVNYDQICYSDKPMENENLYNFIVCSNYEEFKNASQSPKNVNAYIYKNISLDYDIISYYVYYYYCVCDGITVSANIPNNATLVFISNFHRLIIGSEYYDFYLNCKTKFIIDVKENITLDYSFISSNSSSIEFTSSKEYLYIFPYPRIRNIRNSFQIKVPDELTIYSPAPQYFSNLFGSHIINYSTNWTYYHLSDDGKSIYGNQPSIQFESFNNDDNLPGNIVLAVGSNDYLTLPLNWVNTHNVFIYQKNSDYFELHKPLNISYEHDSVTFDHKMRIVSGYINVKTAELFMVNTYFPCSHYVHQYPYNVKLIMTENEHTDLYVGSMNASCANYYNNNIINLYKNNNTNSITVNATDSDHMQQFIKLHTNGTTITNIRYYIDYKYICYYPFDDPYSKCPGTKYYHISGISTLLSAAAEYPELYILVTTDLNIPYTTGDNLMLNPLNENIEIDLPFYPETMTVSENNVISFNYSDGSYYEIMNTSIIDVTLAGTFKIIVNSNTDSLIQFTLKSDVFISAEVNNDANFNINVYKNNHHLYTDDLSQFGKLLNNSLDLYIRICAHDPDTISYCSFPRNDAINEVFTDPFSYNEVEIALSSTPKEIYLPTIDYQVLVYILPSSTADLTLNFVNSLLILNDKYVVNDYWDFKGVLEILRFKISSDSSLSITEQVSVPIILQLTSSKTLLDLKNCEKLNNSQITILKHGDGPNEIIVFGTNESYYNFLSNLGDHDGITIIHNSTQKYLCICKGVELCNKCAAGIDGMVDKVPNVLSDPGENVKIRVFVDTEMPSNIFNNEHEVFIDGDCTLNLTDIDTVDQNIESGINIDKLHFVNGSNILLKPNDISINIVMRQKEQGSIFNIEMNTFLRLNVTNSDESDIFASRLPVSGFGELNCYDYPFERIRPEKTVRVIKGVYIICGVNEGNDICSYQSVERYKRLDHLSRFKPNMDTNSKILVFLDSYTSSIDTELGYLSDQKIQFIRKESRKSSLLDDKKEPVKLRFLSTTELINKEDATTGLSSAEGSAILDNSDSDLFVVGFNENLTIKQEGNVPLNTSTITIQPMSDKGTIFIDDSVDIENQKLRIESETDKKVSLTIHTNKNITDDKTLMKFIDVGNSNVQVTLGDPNNKKAKGLPIGAIVGIVVGVVVIVSVIVAVVIFFVNKNKLMNQVISTDKQELSDSTF